MDIISSHQHGLAEQLEIEAQALAGRDRDAGQRAIIYHHLADSLGLANGYALLAAEGALAIGPAAAELRRSIGRRRWRIGGARRAQMVERVAAFESSLLALDRERCAAALLAYRLIATPGLGAQAQARVEPDLIAAMTACQSAKGAADALNRRRLFLAQQRVTEAMMGQRIEQAIAALDWPFGPRAVRRAIAALRISVTSFERAERDGMRRVEARLRKPGRLPPAFATNPAQAFFALQRQVAERRRSAADFGLISPADAVRLAA